jgi:hypothetical protein
LATNVSVFDGTALGVGGQVTVTYPPFTPPTTGTEKFFAALDFISLLPETAVECENIQQLAAYFGQLSYADLTPPITDLCNADAARLLDDFYILLDPPRLSHCRRGRRLSSACVCTVRSPRAPSSNARSSRASRRPVGGYGSRERRIRRPPTGARRCTWRRWSRPAG